MSAALAGASGAAVAELAGTGGAVVAGRAASGVAELADGARARENRPAGWRVGRRASGEQRRRAG